MKLSLLILIFLSFLIPSVARAEEPHGTHHLFCGNNECHNFPELDRIGTVFADTPIKVDCFPDEDWDLNLIFSGSWGVTFMMDTDSVEMKGTLCYSLVSLIRGYDIYPSDITALALTVLIHEAYHARNWSGRRDEALVECRAIKHFKSGLHFALGDNWTQAQENVLYPWALAWHWRETRKFDVYYKKDCLK